MAHRSDIPSKLIYTCRCGWVDKGHADPKAATGLWAQMLRECGDIQHEGFRGFPVVFSEQEKRWGVSDGTASRYVVRRGLGIAQKESIALAIFLDVSYAFENMQALWPHSWITDSGFSEEDLISDLLGFYRAVKGIPWEMHCRAVSAEQSFKIWDKHGSVGQHKNRYLRPNYYPCEECKGAGSIFPQVFTSIRPVAPGGLYRKLDSRYFLR